MAAPAGPLFYGLSSLALTVVLSALSVGEPRAEGLTRLDPVALGQLIGLNRAPEVPGKRIWDTFGLATRVLVPSSTLSRSLQAPGASAVTQCDPAHGDAPRHPFALGEPGPLGVQ